MTVYRFEICRICHDPVPQTCNRTKRIYHPECKKFKNYLDAAVRSGLNIELLDGETKRVIRGLLFSAANQFRAPQPRGEDGRYVQASSDHDD